MTGETEHACRQAARRCNGLKHSSIYCLKVGQVGTEKHAIPSQVGAPWQPPIWHWPDWMTDDSEH